MQTIATKKADVNTKKTHEPKNLEDALSILKTIAFERNGNGSTIWEPCIDGQFSRRRLKPTADLLTASGLDDAERKIASGCAVDAVFDKLMLSAGIYRIEGQRVLVARHAPWINSADIGISDVRAMYNRLTANPLGKILLDALNFGQVERMVLWIVNARARITEWQEYQSIKTMCPALCLLGTQGGGKTLIISILSRLLGGRADVSPYMRGDSEFLPDIQSTPLLVADDARDDMSPGQRKLLMTNIKALLYSGGVGINRKHKEPITLRLPWAIVIAGNTPESMPIAEDADMHKLLILNIPRALELTEGDRERISDALSDDNSIAELAAICEGLARELRTDGIADASGRQIVAGWVHPAAAETLAEADPAEAVGDAIRIIIQRWHQNEWEDLNKGVPIRILRLRIKDKCDSATQRRIPTTEARFRELAEKWLERQGVEFAVDKHGVKRYYLGKIWNEQNTKDSNTITL